MGNIISKPKSTKATLKDLHFKITESEKKHKNIIRNNTKAKWRIIFWSGVFVVISLVFAFLDDQNIFIFLSIPILFSTIVYFLSSFYFSYRIDSYNLYVEELKEQRKELIEKLKTEENFLETIELVDRFEGDNTRHLHFSKINQKNKDVLSKVTDVILGGDPSKLYALICKECHYHNGMVPPEEYKMTEFVCYNCNTFNGKKDE
ncbi:hypothetical protein NBO_1043g0001 [Nosema bombycis CQ1]|uniref:Endoplasmic reticulum junction formation protein lunapark n=1 Tax=Nosema bombycis (strain CQ1 / CVCC 102059) TaxID=578461 RepID=R0MFP3_NOSB1|nr:hypothetical protein NBO_1043g0001 [Nosema bombycis CQ1]|eukprot:EOB11578.1 hypothetical protein NBO_1043g0001 [Nosema bombycis CQ1]